MKATGAPEAFVPVKTATLLAAEPFGAVPEGAAFGKPACEGATGGTTGAEAERDGFDDFGKPVDATLGFDDEPAVTVTMTVTGEQVLPPVENALFVLDVAVPVL